MLKRKLTMGDYALIAANLVPVYGVWFEGWSAVEAFIVYALETLLMGILTLLKMLIITLVRGKDLWYNAGQAQPVSGLFFMVFFTVHFGLFALVQTTIFSQAANITPPGSGMMHFFFHWYDYVNHDIAIMLSAFVVSYTLKSFVPFIIEGEYKTVSMMKVMFQPYGRIFVQQFTVIAGSMFLSFGAGKAFILLFAFIRIGFELYINFDGFLDKAIPNAEKQSAKK